MMTPHNLPEWAERLPFSIRDDSHVSRACRDVIGAACALLALLPDVDATELGESVRLAALEQCEIIANG